MKSIKLYVFTNYAFLFLICIWSTLQTLILKVDGAQRSILVFICLLFIINIRQKSFWRALFKPPLIFWVLWGIYAYINTIFQGYNNTPYSTFFVELFAPIFVLLIINTLEFKKRKYIFNIIIVSLYLNLLLIIIELPNLISLRNVSNSSFALNSNEVGVIAITLLLFGYLKHVYDEIKLIYLLLLVIIPIFVIFLSGSRNAFIGFMMIFITYFNTDKNDKHKLKLLKLIFGLCFAISIIYFTLNYTSLGNRIIETKEQSEKMNLNSGTIFDKMGDRGIFYILGFQAFKEHPIYGIGLYNYPKYSGSYVQHSEYMLQLCELGILGSILFLLFYLTIIKRLFLLYRNKSIYNNSVLITHILILIVILFMAASTRVFNSIYFFLLLGITIKFTQNPQLKSNNF